MIEEWKCLVLLRNKLKMYIQIHFSSNNANPSKNNDNENGGGLRLEHGLVVVGFVIGFGFVFAVGLVYAKVQRVRRFKLLDNANGKI